jgi:hypothetical protein
MSKIGFFQKPLQPLIPFIKAIFMSKKRSKTVYNMSEKAGFLLEIDLFFFAVPKRLLKGQIWLKSSSKGLKRC